MNNKPKFTISIPEPCHENWDSMTPTEQGKFCEACQHHVVDFTKKTDAQILSYIAKQQGRVCGRLNDFQQHRNLFLAPVAPVSIWQRFLTLTAFLFTFGFLRAQSETNAEVSAVEQVESTLEESNTLVSTLADSNKVQISFTGTVLNKSDNEPIYGVKVNVVGKDVHGLTNFDGKFKLTFDQHQNDTLPIELSFQYRGKFQSLIVENLDEPIHLQMEAPIEYITVGMIIRNYDFDFGTRIRFDRFGRRED